MGIRKGFLKVEIHELGPAGTRKFIYMGLGRQQNILKQTGKCFTSLAKSLEQGRKGEEWKIRLGRQMGARCFSGALKVKPGWIFFT